MKTELQKGWKYVKAHKKEIAVGAGLVIVGAVTGGVIVHKNELGSVKETHKLIVGISGDKQGYEGYLNFFSRAPKVLGGTISGILDSKDDAIKLVTESCDKLPDDVKYQFIIEAIGE